MRISFSWLKFLSSVNGDAPSDPPLPTDEELLRAMVQEKVQLLAPGELSEITINVMDKDTASVSVMIMRPDKSKLICLSIGIRDDHTEQGVAKDLMQVLASIG